ncbi:MAG: PHP domain-containing protein [Paraclostridium sp.]
MKTYCNYHIHKHDSNIYTSDTAMQISDYINRAVELNHKIISSVAHGWVGNYFDDYLQIEKANKKLISQGRETLKWIFGGEFYWVKDRFEKDNTNGHIIILARNENGRKNINRIMSECNKTGFYGRPRIDLELLFSLPQEDVFVTTACVAFWKYEDIKDIILQMNSHFKYFYLEVQSHNTEKQINLNKRIINISKKYNIPIIAGVDSHYIYPNQEEERNDFLRSEGLVYEDEYGWHMDYPDYNTLFSRFKEQEVLTDDEIEISLENTNEILKFEDIILDKTMKIPTLYENYTQEEKDNKFKQLINELWIKERNNIHREKWNHYIEEIRKEVKEIIDCGMSDYFMLDYEIIKIGKEKYGGEVTFSGRGSAVSEYINKLLAFTDVDRINSKVTMFPERFLTKERILDSATPPDIDFNLSSRTPFIQAQRDLLGEKSTYDLLAFGTLKTKSAWKMYARAYNISPEDADIVSKQIDKYEEKLKYADRDEATGELIEDVNLFDFVDIKYEKLLEGCKKYLGIKTTRKGHPCGVVTSSLNVEEEIGVILCKSETTKKETFVACIESGLIDYFGWLKNDFLIVSVVKTTNDIYRRIGIEPYPVDKILQLIENDKKTWDIYKNGYTLCVNQVEKPGTKKKTMQYAPKNIVELCALIAAVRPSFKTLVKQFLSREDFHYGIKELDELLQTPEMPYSYIFYQEQLMQILGFAGFEIKDTYDIIKSISKKKTYCRQCDNTGNDSMKTCPRCNSTDIHPLVEKFKEQFIEGFSNKINSSDNKEQISKDVWDIVLSFASYGFNSSHSYCMALDSVTQAYLKANYPYEFYEVMLKTYTQKGEKDKVKELKEEMKNFGIHLGDIKFGIDNRDFTSDKDNNLINQSLVSIKGFSQRVADCLYELGIKEYDNFLEIRHKMKESKIVQSNHVKELIDIGYFKDYGSKSFLHECNRLYDRFYTSKKISKEKLTSVEFEIVKKYSRETDKQFADPDNIKIITELLKDIENEITLMELLEYDIKKFGEVITTFEDMPKNLCLITKHEKPFTTDIIELYSLATGRTATFKVSSRVTGVNPIAQFDIIRFLATEDKPKKKRIELDEIDAKTGKKKCKYINTDEMETWLSKYEVVYL